jgi:uncharacterized protein (TIGR02996 family)
VTTAEFAALYGKVKYSRLDTAAVDAFHNKVVEAPHEQLPHLVFADYLEENEHPELASVIRDSVQYGNTHSGRVHSGEAKSKEPFLVTASPVVSSGSPSEAHVNIYHRPSNRTRNGEHTTVTHTARVPAETVRAMAARDPAGLYDPKFLKAFVARHLPEQPS